MKTTQFAIVVGLFLGAVLAFGTFTQFFLVLICGAVAWAVGLVLEGRVDIRGLTDRRRR